MLHKEQITFYRLLNDYEPRHVSYTMPDARQASILKHNPLGVAAAASLARPERAGRDLLL